VELPDGDGRNAVVLLVVDQLTGVATQLVLVSTQAWGASSLEVTVRVGYRHAASFEFPKSWLQQGQQWRILAGLEQLVQGAPTRAAELRAAAAAARARATDSQALLGRPFEHADQLAAALARQQQLEAAMRDQATAEAPEPAAQAS
jgi:hypothetical protein